jgi:hypothetical protein
MRRLMAGLGLGLALGALLTGCAGVSSGSAGGASPAYYPGPPYWDPGRGTFIDPISGQPMNGGGR